VSHCYEYTRTPYEYSFDDPLRPSLCLSKDQQEEKLDGSTGVCVPSIAPTSSTNRESTTAVFAETSSCTHPVHNQ